MGEVEMMPSFDDLTPKQAAATPSESGCGVTLDGMHAWWPGLNCIHCGRFVGRAGYVSVQHFEMSSEIAAIEADCLKCDRKNEAGATTDD